MSRKQNPKRANKRRTFWYFLVIKSTGTWILHSIQDDGAQNPGLLTPLMCRTDFVGCSHSGVWLPTVAHRSSRVTGTLTHN
ncbi:hypothetical protein KBC86_00245 [Candidatus Gracilibacteria bacterium]|nr:hypothetical protein [Candidatus Gracilibacteria bacterium]